MNDGNTFNTSAALAILLLGESGTGKSSIAIRFPSPGFMLGDKNIRHASEWAKEHNHAWSYAEPEFDPTGKPVSPFNMYGRSLAILKEAGVDENVKTIVDDGLTFISDYLQTYLVAHSEQVEKPLMVAGEKSMTRSLWGPFQNHLKSRIGVGRSFKKPYIMVAHLTTGENDMTGAKEQQVALQGAFQGKIGSYFTDVLQVVAVPSSDPKYAKSNGIRRFLRTEPTHRCSILKNSLKLPAEIDVEEFATRLGLAK